MLTPGASGEGTASGRGPRGLDTSERHDDGMRIHLTDRCTFYRGAE